jgi:threonine aldolase
MAEAEVGDDVYSEDPTVNRLQEMAAERFGKEAALLVLSGTMGNLVSLLTHCGRGDEAILGDRCHTFLFEQGGTSGVGGIHPHPIVDGPDAQWELEALKAAIRPDDEHVPRTKVICLENTHNAAGGRVLPPDYVAAISAVAALRHLKLHVDGARIFNAAVALGVPVADLARGADSLTFCLTKGLACPVGSIIVGDRDFIAQARRNRKILGGGMRQAGVFAAAGIVALNEMVERLAEDHANARRLAEGLADLPGIAVDPSAVETNIVFIELNGSVAPMKLAARLRALGVVIAAARGDRIRLVTHYGIDAADIDRALFAFERALAGD